ncbi:MAG: N-acetylmuramoyl-L-alanine amidase [Paracoccaceae bacterium]
MNLNVHLSPNCGPRRDGLKPEFVVLHYTAMGLAEDALHVLCSPEREVSAHYLISKTGKLWQLVPESDRAWHAGKGEWQGLPDMNSRSIGIELDNDGQTPFEEAQMAVLETLLAGILTRWNIPPSNVIGHSDMAPGRKIDPGPLFDWGRLERAGLAGRRGSDIGPSDPDAMTFRKVAQHAGYTADVDDETLLSAVRLRYRPNASGPLSPEDFTPIGHAALWT